MDARTLPLPVRIGGSGPTTRRVAGGYDPWLDLRRNWPLMRIVIEPMYDDLLGELRLDDGVVALRAGTSAAQRRCTLAHEIVHLERGVRECGRWLDREEHTVHLTAARRLIGLGELIAAMRDLGGTGDSAALAQLLDVDSETLLLRLDELDRTERLAVRRALSRCASLWSVA